jgi:hypothetical protein
MVGSVRVRVWMGKRKEYRKGDWTNKGKNVANFSMYVKGRYQLDHLA